MTTIIIHTRKIAVISPIISLNKPISIFIVVSDYVALKKYDLTLSIITHHIVII
jgi:hypothetical protein